jgi:sortase A
MDPNSPKLQKLLKISLVVLLSIFLIMLVCFLKMMLEPQKKTQTLQNDTQTKSEKEHVGIPVRLKIPSINVDAIVEHVGIIPNGEMGVPQNTINVGWFSLGSRPGDVGSAVIAGHLNGLWGQPGVFASLFKLKFGDKIYTEDDQGVIKVFVVQDNQIYNPGYADAIFSNNNSVHLNLITCEGSWNETRKSFSKRRIVFADLEN